MRIQGFSIALLLVCAGPVCAQQNGAPDDAQLQQMMQGMSQMAACFQNIDQDRLEAMGKESKAKEKEIKQLCADGKRDEAQSEAMAFGQSLMNSEEFKQLQQCGEMGRSMMPDMSRFTASDDEDGNGPRHVCDDL